jgi:adenosine deaminase
LAKDQGVELPSQTPEGLLELVFKEHYEDLPQYLKGFAYTCAVLREEEALERTAFELAEDCLAEGVRYIEVRFAPHLHLKGGLTIDRVLSAVNRGLAPSPRSTTASSLAPCGCSPPASVAITKFCSRY